MTNWKKEIEIILTENNETWDDVVSNTLSDIDLYKDFDNGYGGSEGESFTMWTKNYIYFPVVYDGAEWVASVPRNPCNIKSTHVGGE